MPLIKSSSKEAVGENIRRERAAGRPQAQSVAIALNTQREAKRKGYATGGAVRPSQESSMADTKSNSGHVSAATSSRPTYSDKGVSGPVPMQHRNKLGHTNLQADPQGAGPVSKAPKVNNKAGHGVW